MTRKPVTDKQKQRRGRPPLGRELDPWLAKMYPYIKAKRSIRSAAQLVAEAHHKEMPSGSLHGRKLASTIDLLRREFPRWVKEEADREAQRAQENSEAAAVEKNWQPHLFHVGEHGGWSRPFWDPGTSQIRPLS